MKTIKTLIMLFLFLGGIVFAANMSGLEIMDKVYYRFAPKTLEATLEMTLINSSGNERKRTIKQFIRNEDGVEKKIMFFQEPADVRGTSFMNWSYDSGKPDDQWIYLPALKKVKRISSDSKGDYFLGSDFTYDDLGDRNPKDDYHKILREETLNEEECFVIESTPKDSDYMYSKTVTWVVKGKWLGLKKVFYDEDGELLKTLTIKSYKNIGGYWILTESIMENHQNDHSTRMRLNDIRVDQSVSDSYFSERRMQRGI